MPKSNTKPTPDRGHEVALYNPILVAVSRVGARLFRNNTGLGWIGKIIKREPGKLTLAAPRPLHAGLCKGSSDLIGWTPVKITPDMVGKTVAVFTAAEVKHDEHSKREPEQEAFIAAVNKAGGIGIFTYNPDDAAEQIIKRKTPGR